MKAPTLVSDRMLNAAIDVAMDAGMRLEASRRAYQDARRNVWRARSYKDQPEMRNEYLSIAYGMRATARALRKHAIEDRYFAIHLLTGDLDAFAKSGRAR